MPHVDPLTVVIADDSALYRQMLHNVLRRIEGVEVVGMAADGREAIECVRRLRPDALTLDVHMPVLDGISVLRQLRAGGSTTRAIMVSSLTGEGAPATVEALLEGAFDYLPKPTGLEPHLARQAIHASLVEKLANLRAALAPKPAPSAVAHGHVPAGPRAAGSHDAIVIGCSTGGPEALRTLVPRLPPDLQVPVFIVQHMPPGFTATLAARLDATSAVRVVEAADGMAAEPGTVHVAPGGRHLRIARRERTMHCVLDDSAPRHGCRPSVDVLLESMVEVHGGRILAFVLTGMGCDGLHGCRGLKARGGRVVAQSPEGCAVFGMPKAVIENGLADAVLSLEAIGETLACGTLPSPQPSTSERTSSAT